MEGKVPSGFFPDGTLLSEMINISTTPI